MLARRRRPGFWALGPLGEMQNEIERFITDMWGGEEGPSSYWGYKVDVHEDGDHVYVEAELPGLTKDEIDITLENGIMTIRGEKKSNTEKRDQNYHMRERLYGKFSRSFQLPTTVDDAKVEATLEDGVLKVLLHKREEVKPKRIEVNVK